MPVLDWKKYILMPVLHVRAGTSEYGRKTKIPINKIKTKIFVHFDFNRRKIKNNFTIDCTKVFSAFLTPIIIALNSVKVTIPSPFWSNRAYNFEP